MEHSPESAAGTELGIPTAPHLSSHYLLPQAPDTKQAVIRSGWPKRQSYPS